MIGELEAAVATHPFSESLWELLITAQYRAGRQADALASYQQVRTLLATELGLDPRPQLQELEHRILVQDAALEVPARPAARTRTPRRSGNLPSMAAELVGRDDEVAAISDLLGQGRLVEIVGPGGVGKTAVALAVGRGLTTSLSLATDGIWLARLEGASTPEEVVDALVGAVDGPGGEAALFESFKDASAVVILDNCEHVLDAAAALAVRLLDAAPGLRILCTSQVALDIDGEVVIELAPLALPDGVELFTRRAAAQHRTRANAPDDALRARPVPVPGRSAAGDRARRGTHQDPVRRRDHPAPRGPVPGPGRPDQPQAGTTSVAAVDHLVELRPAVSRRSARPVGAGHVRRWGTPAGGGVRPRSPRRAGSRRDRRGRPAGEPIAGDRR